LFAHTEFRTTQKLIAIHRYTRYLAFLPFCRFAPSLIHPLDESPPGLFTPGLVRSLAKEAKTNEQIRQGVNKPGGKWAEGQIIRLANQQRGETANGWKSHNSCTNWHCRQVDGIS